MKKIFSITGTITGWFLTLLSILIVVFQISDLMTKLFWLTLIAFLLVLAAFIASIVIYSKEIKTLKSLVPLENSCYIEKFDGRRQDIIRTKRSDMYKVGSLVTIYYLDDDIPQRIGYGAVENQQDAFQTVVVKKYFDDYNDIWGKIKANESTILKKSYIVPTFFEDYIDEYKTVTPSVSANNGGEQHGNA